MAKYQKGESGNKVGRPKGIRDRRHDLRDRLQARAPELVDAAIKQAIGGDSQALRLCLDRIMPALRPVTPPIAVESGSLEGKIQNVLLAITRGDVSASDAAQLIATLAAATTAIEREKAKIPTLDAFLRF